MSERIRSLKITFRVTSQDKELIEARFNRLGFRARGSFYRKMLIDGRIFIIDNTPVKEVSSKLSKINTNINQIAKRVNSTSNIYAEDILEIKEMMNKIWQLQKSILSKLP